jgi:protocatechuate 3,4-dioxygenase beta subunit
MRRLWPILVLVLAAAATWWLLGRQQQEEPSGDGASREAPTPETAPELRGASRSNRADVEPTRGAPNASSRPASPAAEPFVFLSGKVLDAETGLPIQGAAVWATPHADPCPRWSSDPLRDAAAPGRGKGFGGWLATTDAAGAYRLSDPRGVSPESGSLDVFVNPPHHVPTVACAPALPGEKTFRVERGLVVSARVTDTRSRPVKDAQVWTEPAPSTPAVPGHASRGVTNERGEATLDGLLPGDVTVSLDHPDFYPAKAGPYDPQKDTSLSFVLVPALKARFHVSSNDGRPVRNATVHWTTTGPNAKSELLLLTCTDRDVKGEKGSEVDCEPVRIPCDAPAARFEVKADGYGAWRSGAEDLPPDGGERQYDVVLSSDASQGSVKFLLEDERGQHVAWNANRSMVSGVMRLDGPPAAAGYVMEGGEDLRFPAMPPGKYRFFLLGVAFAPVTVEAEVTGGREEQVQVATRPPAKWRVRFRGPERTTVTFRITQGGTQVTAIPEGPVTTTVDEASKETVYSAGEDGVVLSGLGAGSYTVEVTSADVAATPTTVRLDEGRTEETEIDVQPR